MVALDPALLQWVRAAQESAQDAQAEVSLELTYYVLHSCYETVRFVNAAREGGWPSW
jgi:hypothetical protein